MPKPEIADIDQRPLIPLSADHLDPVDAQPQRADSTIGLLPMSRIHTWARLHGVHDELCFFAHCLRVQGGIQTDFLGGALDGLAHCAQTIRLWGRRGQDTFGLEALADQWLLTKRSLGQLPERAITRSPLDDFRGSAKTQYLHLLLHSRLLDGPQARAQLILRSWAVIRAHQFAADGLLSEAYLGELCTNLRIATYESIPDWGPVLSALVVKDQSFDMVAADLQAKPADVQGRMPSGSELRAKHLAFLSSMDSLGSGGKRALVGGGDIDSKVRQVKPPSRKALSVGADSATEPLPEYAEYVATDAEGDVDTQVAHVDSQATPRQQEHEARSIYLTTALDASLVRWRWSTPSPHEVAALREKVHTSLRDESSAPLDRLLAAVVWVALFAGRSLEEACRISLGGDATRFSQWTLDLQTDTLRRKAPRREAHWRPRGEATGLIHPSTDEIGWPLPSQVATVLRRAAFAAGRPQYLRDVWVATSSLTLDQVFLTWVQQSPPLARVRPGMLANTLRQDVFERTGDGLLARLLGGRDRDGLPGAAAYGTYLSSALPKAIDPAPLTSAQQDTNVAGSLLAPVTESILSNGFRRAYAELARLKSEGSWIEIHNLTALYWDAILRAATGIRPSNMLWANRESIDWTHAFVFVDEKASPLQRSGRLVPIPADILEAFRRTFVERHLPATFDAVRQSGFVYDPATAGNLLFLIETNGPGPVACVPLTNTHREGLGVERPLPLNVFRHRLRTGLQRIGADPEVIDSVLGHSDGSSATHGPYSMRTWSPDMEQLRPALSTMLDALDIQLPHVCDGVAPASVRVTSVGNYRLMAGLPSRQKAARLAITESLATISRFLIEKLPLDRNADAALSQDQILKGLVRLTDVQVEQLENLLTLTDKGMPSTTGALRHAYLVKLARRAWDVLEKPVRLRRRLRPTEPEPSAYTVDAPGALDRLQRLRSALDALFDERPHPSHVTVSDARVLVTMDLIANSRITAARVLSAPLESRVNCRLAMLGSDHYLEWSPDASLEERPDAPIQRFRITPRAARLLEDLLAKARSVDVDAHASSALYAIGVALDVAEGASFQVLREKAASIVAQCNVIDLPGAVAGYLNGRLMTAALGQADFVRFRRQVFVRPTPTATPEEADREPPLAMARKTTTDLRADPSEWEDAARRLFRDVNKELVRLRTPEAYRHRQQGLHNLRLCVSANGEVSTTIRLLCLWAIDRLRNEDQERPLGTGSALTPSLAPVEGKPKRRKRIQTVSALRYLSALKPIFVDLASDVDILSLEAEELADFYQAVLSEARVQNLNYLYRRLRDFHRFAMQHGATAIDWSELVPADAPDLGAPGFIDEAAYQNVLEALATTPPPTNVQPWQLQVFIILCYRFGLRGGEVLHLQQGDWRTLSDGLRLVLVRPRRFHKLKSPAARRQVPLVFPLTAREEDALVQLERHHEVAALGTTKPPLLGEADNPQRAVADAIVRQHLNRVIQAVTGQVALSLHDMRHSLACRVWQALESPSMPDGACDNGLTANELAHLRQTLLGPKSPTNTRRAAWVLSNLLGHAHVARTLRSYVHFVAEAAEAAVSPALEAVRPWSTTRHQHGKDLFERLERVPNRLDITPIVNPIQTLTPALAFDALVHFAQGTPPVDTAACLHVSVDAMYRLSKLSSGLHGRLGSNSKRVPSTARVASEGLLSRVPTTSFQRLRGGLASLKSTEQPASALPGLADAHVLGMVAPERQVNMWTRAQMSCVANLIEAADLDPRRLTLTGAPQVLRSLTEAAIVTGWLAADGPVAAHAPHQALCRRLVTRTLPAPTVIAPMDIRIANRLVFELAPARDGWIHDRIELWISLICVHSCSKESPNALVFDPDVG